MTTPNWADDLPQRVLQDGYQETIPDGRLRSGMERGPPKVRRATSAAMKPAQCTFHVTADQKARLERFWDEETDGGILPFTIPDQARDRQPVLDDTGLSLETDEGVTILCAEVWLACFGETPPTFTPMARGRQWRAAFPLSVYP